MPQNYNNQKWSKKLPMPLLERLIDREPLHVFDTAATSQLSLQQLYTDVRNNLEKLLNTRLRYISYPEQFRQLECSLITYGLADFMHGFYGSRINQVALSYQIKASIEKFEPRLRNIGVNIQDGYGDEMDRIFRIRIEATLEYYDGNRDAVFESALDLTKNNFAFNADY